MGRCAACPVSGRKCEKAALEAAVTKLPRHRVRRAACQSHKLAARHPALFAYMVTMVCTQHCISPP